MTIANTVMNTIAPIVMANTPRESTCTGVIGIITKQISLMMTDGLGQLFITASPSAITNTGEAYMVKVNGSTVSTSASKYSILLLNNTLKGCLLEYLLTGSVNPLWAELIF